MGKLIEKLKQYLHPKPFKELTETNDTQLNAFLNHITKLTTLADIYIKKEILLDKFLTSYSQKELTALANNIDELKETITQEWGGLEEFKKTINEIISIIRTKKTELNQIFGHPNLYAFGMYPLNYEYQQQFKIIEQKEKLLQDKYTAVLLIRSIFKEYNSLKAIFELETKYAQDFEKINELKIPEIQILIKNQKYNTNELTKIKNFTQTCITFAQEKNIQAIIITEDSARILGIILQSKLKEQKIPIKIFGFDPTPLTRRRIHTPTFKPTEQQIIDAFIKERRALAKEIQRKNILIVDEFAASGDTLIKTAQFFEKIGAKKAYTAACFARVPAKMYMDIIGTLSPEQTSWYDIPVSGKQKYYKRKNTKIEEIKTKTMTLRTKYKIINDLYAQLVKDYTDFMKKGTQ